MSEKTIELVRRNGGEVVEASLVDGMKPPDLLVVEREWGPERSHIMQELLREGVPRREWPQSLHWDWSKKAPELKFLESTGFGIVFERKWQGVMLTKTASHVSRLEAGKPLVYIDYLEAAPWNWKVLEMGIEGEFRGVGSVLFWTAINQSVQEGFHGRIGLHSLPQAESFYAKAGMTALGANAAKHNLPYMELTREQAERHLKEGESS